MSLVLIVDDMPMIRELLNAGLTNAGYQTLLVSNGKQALETVKSRVPDLILLDLAMPVMGGLAVLEALRADPATATVPVILLTASLDKDNVLKAARWGVHDYVLKSEFSLKALLSRVRKYIGEPRQEAAGPAKQTVPSPQAPAPAVQPTPQAARPPVTAASTQRLLSREDCIARAQQAMQARTLSGVVAEVIKLAASPRGDMSDLASLVARDPVLSARILQAANSVSYASTRGVVSTIAEAVRNVGCATVRDIAGALGVFDVMPASGPDGFNPIRCWQHSFAVATLCQRLAPASLGGVAYLVGLCHDLGEILFHSHFASEYRQVIEAQQATGKRRDEVERLMLGMAHGELVQTILTCLGLPDEIRQPIEEHHRTGPARRAESAIGKILSLADLYANGVLLASSIQSPLAPLTRPECRAATGQENPQRPDGVLLRGEIFTMTAMLARLSPKEEASLLAPPYSKRPGSICLVRDPSLSAFDPIHAALESIIEVAVREAMPAGAELEGYSGVVVLARSTSVAGLTATEITAANRTRPVLWLTGRIDEGSVPPTSVPPILWPLPLNRLGEFADKLGVARAPEPRLKVA
jgi:CheY-like chemotaxis protein/HD-like signal output (HDOD) protein